MGQVQSVDPVHARMYMNLIQINDPMKRIQIINTCMASMEYVQSAKRSGVYSYLLHYISTVQNGGNPPLLPGEQGAYAASSEAPRQAATQDVAVPRSFATGEQLLPSQREVRSLQNMNMQNYFR
jgi:hypothetical protein